MSGYHHPFTQDHGHDRHDHQANEHGHRHHDQSHDPRSSSRRSHSHSHSHHDGPLGASGSLLPSARSRRAFLGDFGRGTLALAVFTPMLAACGGSDTDDQAADTEDSDAANAEGAETSTESSSTTQAEESAAGEGADGGELRWARAELGFVSAYVLARGNTAAIVDTGTNGSAEAIGQTLADIGLNYSNVAHVILTHHHGDHVGSIDAVLGNTPSATVYAGAADLGQINVTAGGQPVDDGRIQALTGGEDIFGFEALATPGHTAGHMAVIDHAAGLLVAGDAIFTEGTEAVEGPARFFADVPESRQSIAKMAELSFNTLLVGHGDPLESGADAAVAALAASFG